MPILGLCRSHIIIISPERFFISVFFLFFHHISPHENSHLFSLLLCRDVPGCGQDLLPVPGLASMAQLVLHARANDVDVNPGDNHGEQH